MTEWIITSSVLILIIAAIRYALRGKISLRLQYTLWALVLLRLLVPVSLAESPVSVMNTVQAITQVWEAKAPAPVSLSPSALGNTEDSLPPDVTVSVNENSVTNEYHHVFHWGIWLKIVWYAGIAVVGLVLLLSNLSFGRKLRKTRKEFDAPGVGLPVYVVPVLPSPCLSGLFCPAVYITPEVAADEPKLRHVLAHEYTHYRHGDHIWSALRCAALALHWYNPLVWLAAALSRRDAELACDEGALRRIGEENRAEYGRTLIGLTCEKPRAVDLLRCATTMTGSKSTIKERIRLIAKSPKTAAYTLAAVLLIAALAVGCTFTGAEPETTQPVVSEPESIILTVLEDSENIGSTTLTGEDMDWIIRLLNGDGWITAQEAGNPDVTNGTNNTNTGVSIHIIRSVTDNGTVRQATDQYVAFPDGNSYYIIAMSGRDDMRLFLPISKETYDSLAQTVSDARPGSVAEGIDVPDIVLEMAKKQAAADFSTYSAESPDAEYTDWRITSLEWVYAYDDIDGAALDVYRMNYEFLSEAPENVVLAGGMYITDDNWVCPWSPNCTYLVFDTAGDVYYFAMVENDCYPGDEAFTKDLTQKFEEVMFPQFTAQYTPTEGIIGQAVSYPYDLDFRGYITGISESTVSVDEIVWDTEGNYANGYAIINDDTGVTDYPLASDCEFWLLKDYWYPCQRLTYEAFTGFLAAEAAEEHASVWIFSENAEGDIVMIGMQYQP